VITADHIVLGGAAGSLHGAGSIILAGSSTSTSIGVGTGVGTLVIPQATLDAPDRFSARW